MSGLSLRVAGALAVCLSACAAEEPVGADRYLVSSEPEVLAEGFQWSEGPLWIEEGSYLLFSDVPKNVVYKWSSGKGAETFLDPSGYSGPPTDVFREPGINGMIVGEAGHIIAADHGSRAIVDVNLVTKEKTILADAYDGKRFNSPNDLVRAKDGAIYFTDPSYGLAGLNESPAKELPFNGVFRLAPDGAVTLIDDNLTFPNGIALSPDERTLYVSVTDKENAAWYAYDLSAEGVASNRRMFRDARPAASAGAVGHPDGIAVADSGEIFAVGPGGLYIFPSEHAEPVIVDLGRAASNCGFGADGRSLFVTAGDRVLRFRTKVAGRP